MMLYIKSAMCKVENKVRDFFSKENGEVNIVAIVVLIGVAVILAIVFKDAIKKLIDALFTAIQGNANDAIKKY